MIFEFSIPIKHRYGYDEIQRDRIFIEADHCPSKQELLEFLKKTYKLDGKAFKSVEAAQDWAVYDMASSDSFLVKIDFEVCPLPVRSDDRGDMIVSALWIHKLS